MSQQPQYVLCPPGFQPPAGQQVVYVVPQQQQQQQQPTTPPQGQFQQQQQTSPPQQQFSTTTVPAQMFPAPGQQPVPLAAVPNGSPQQQQPQQQFVFQAANGQQQQQHFIIQQPNLVAGGAGGPPPYASGSPQQQVPAQQQNSFTLPSPAPSPSSVALGTPQTHRLSRPPAYRTSIPPQQSMGGSAGRPRLGSGFSSNPSAAQSANTVYLQNTNNSVSPPPLSISASQSMDPMSGTTGGGGGGGKGNNSRSHSHQFTKLENGDFGSGTLDQTFGTLDSLAGGELGEALAEAKVQAETDGTAQAMIEELRREPTDRAVRAKVLKIPNQLCMAMVVVLDRKNELLLGLCNKDRGNVVCHLIEKLGGDQCFCLIRFALDNFLTLAKNQSGCIALPRILQFVKPTQREVFFDTMLTHFDELITHQYGNYVVKHFLCAGESKNISGIVDQIVRAPRKAKNEKKDDDGEDEAATSPASPAILKETSKGMSETFAELVGEEGKQPAEDDGMGTTTTGREGSVSPQDPLGQGLKTTTTDGGEEQKPADALEGSTTSSLNIAKATGVDVLLNDSTLDESAAKGARAAAEETKEEEEGSPDTAKAAASEKQSHQKVIEGSSPTGVNVYETAARDLAVDHERIAALATNKFGSHIIDDAFKMCKDSSALKLVLAVFKDQATLRILSHDKFANYNIQSAFKYINSILQDSNLQQYCLQNTIPVMGGCQYQQNIMKHAVTTGGGRGGGNQHNNRGGGGEKREKSSPTGGRGGSHRNSQGPNNSPGNRGGGANKSSNGSGGQTRGGGAAAAVRPMGQLQPPSPPQQQQTFTINQQGAVSSANTTPPGGAVTAIAVNHVDPFQQQQQQQVLSSASQSMSPLQQQQPGAAAAGTFTIFPANR